MSFKPDAIELDGGVVRFGTVEGANGVRHEWTDVGRRHFFIDLIEEDGSRLGLWSGNDYGAAILEAERARVDFEIEEPVRDLVVGGAR